MGGIRFFQDRTGRGRGRESKMEAQELEHIKKAVAGVESAFNRHDAEALVHRYTQDVVWVNVAGMRLKGKDEILRFGRKAFASALQDSYARYVVEDISFLKTDVAVVNIRQFPTTKEGQVIEGGQGSVALFVMTKHNGDWFVAAGQNSFLPKSSP
ncbi:SgcJ/EcaC family oxidoreductase [Archangium violaceum]|nr:SgcJ/EcaC family oxidoreductase [Archangium violaceum]